MIKIRRTLNLGKDGGPALIKRTEKLVQQAAELGRITSLLPKSTNKIARVIEQRDEAKDEQAQLHREMETLRFEAENTPERQQARRKRDQKAIRALKL